MNQRALDEMRHRTGMDSWLFYVWAIPSTLGAVLLTWLTFRNGISALMADPKDFYLWLICTAAAISFWYPGRKKQEAPRRPNPFSVMPGWVFYVLAIPASAGTAFMTWYVFRYGVALIIVDPTDFYLWLICLGALATLWRARPKKPKDQIRLNLE